MFWEKSKITWLYKLWLLHIVSKYHIFSIFVKTSPCPRVFTSYRGSGLFASEKRLLLRGVDSVEVLDLTQSLTFVRDACNAPVLLYEGLLEIACIVNNHPALRREKSWAERGGWSWKFNISKCGQHALNDFVHFLRCHCWIYRQTTVLKQPRKLTSLFTTFPSVCWLVQSNIKSRGKSPDCKWDFFSSGVAQEGHSQSVSSVIKKKKYVSPPMVAKVDIRLNK